MKKFVVFTESEYIVDYQLSISNKIIDNNTKECIINIIRDWLLQLGIQSVATVSESKSISLNITNGRNFANVYKKDSNVIIQIAHTVEHYVTKEV